MKKPVIGIIPTFHYDTKDNNPYLDTANFVTMYEELIKECGGIPIGLVHKDAALYQDICDGYLWPGGCQILTEYYPLIEDAITNEKPFLGICLGAQAIATYFNIKDDQKKHLNLSFKEVYDLYKQDNPYLVKIEDTISHNHYVTKDINSINAAKHKININQDTLLYQIYGKQNLDVVSLHGFKINRVPEDVIVSAKAEDQVIEVIEYTKGGNHILGCMYHPEIIQDKKPFEWLVRSVNNKKDSK